MLWGYLVSKAPKNRKSSNCFSYVFRDDLFNDNNIQIVRCRHHTGNKYSRQKAEVVSKGIDLTGLLGGHKRSLGAWGTEVPRGVQGRR